MSRAGSLRSRRNELAGLLRSGHLVTILPGVYAVARETHRLLRRIALDTWCTNVEIRTTRGLVAVVDVAFLAERVVIELDSWEFHRSRAAFELDRREQAALTADGWRVLRFTWRHVFEEPEWVRARVREALAHAAAELAA